MDKNTLIILLLPLNNGSMHMEEHQPKTYHILLFSSRHHHQHINHFSYIHHFFTCSSSYSPIQFEIQTHSFSNLVLIETENKIAALYLAGKAVTGRPFPFVFSLFSFPLLPFLPFLQFSSLIFFFLCVCCCWER